MTVFTGRRRQSDVHESLSQQCFRVKPKIILLCGERDNEIGENCHYCGENNIVLQQHCAPANRVCRGDARQYWLDEYYRDLADKDS